MKKACALVVAAVGMAFPAAAAAATATTDVTGTVGSELSVAATAPAPMVFSQSTDGTGASVVTVTSTEPDWTLSISDAGSTTPGQMDKVDCLSRAALTGSLATPLAWAAPLAGTSGSLSATPATVSDGALIEAVAVSFTQGIGATEQVVQGDCYQLTVTWTAT